MKKIMYMLITVVSFLMISGCNRTVKADIYATVYPVEFIVNEIA